MATMLSENELSSALTQLLSAPPSKVGRRLRSEHDLAKIFGIRRWKVRESVDRLVENGILVRRKGSGTYVRSIPCADLHADNEPVEKRLEVSTPEIFADLDSNPSLTSTRLQPTHQQKQLNLGLWGNLRNSEINQIILSSLAQRTEETGHRLTIHSITDDIAALSARELGQRLRANPCDGYFVQRQFAKLFTELSSSIPTRKVFISAGGGKLSYEPNVFEDCPETVGRAVQLLAAEGYKRIALIALEEAGHDSQPFIKAYKRAVEDCGLKYEAMEFCNNSVVASMAGTRRLLDRKNPPDAIYVADDFVFYGVAEALAVSNVKPGVDLGVITLSNRGHQLPPGNDWSRLELDPHLFGHIAVDSLLRIIQTAGTEAGNIGVYASWRPGQTHKRPV